MLWRLRWRQDDCVLARLGRHAGVYLFSDRLFLARVEERAQPLDQALAELIAQRSDALAEHEGTP